MTGQPADLVFYYSLTLPSTVINKTNNGTDVIQTANGFIFADTEFLKPIGRFAFDVTIYNTDKTEGPFVYDATGTNVFFLPQGTISNSINLPFIKLPGDNYVVPPKKVNVFQILSGSGDFLNARGIITQITSEIGVRRGIQVYFEK